MSNHSIFTCECCGADYLINFQARTFEPLFDEQVEFDDEATHELDLDDDLYEEEITAEPEPGYTINDSDHNAKSYSDGTPVVYGNDEVKDGKTVRHNTPRTNQGSGITVETQMGQSKPQHTVRQKKRTAKMKPATAMKGVFAPKKKKLSEMTDADHSRDGFEVSGGDATQDFVGLTGADGHFDNLLQAAYEADLSSRNIPNY
jgi:hypothetical protein